MSDEDPKMHRVPGLHGGDFVPLTVEEFQNAYSTFLAVRAGKLPSDPLPEEYFDAPSGEMKAIEDTPFNRAWVTAGKTIDDDNKRLSFYKRLEMVMPIIRDKKYAKFIGWGQGTMHVALVVANATVPFSIRTTPKALRAAFDAIFRQALAASVDTGKTRQ
jgi:hypothetical protein